MEVDDQIRVRFVTKTESLAVPDTALSLATACGRAQLGDVVNKLRGGSTLDLDFLWDDKLVQGSLAQHAARHGLSTENVAELEDDIAAALGDIERLTEESELYFQRSQEKTIYVLTTVTAIFLPLQFVTGLFGMNFKYMPQLNDRGAYYLLLWICLIYTVLALALVWWCSSGRRRSLKHHDIEAA